eukprot:scaffold9894_cov118-Isochrysis_galbana.AAC.5
MAAPAMTASRIGTPAETSGNAGATSADAGTSPPPTAPASTHQPPEHPPLTPRLGTGVSVGCGAANSAAAATAGDLPSPPRRSRRQGVPLRPQSCQTLGAILRLRLRRPETAWRRALEIARPSPPCAGAPPPRPLPIALHPAAIGHSPPPRLPPLLEPPRGASSASGPLPGSRGRGCASKRRSSGAPVTSQREPTLPAAPGRRPGRKGPVGRGELGVRIEGRLTGGPRGGSKRVK